MLRRRRAYLLLFLLRTGRQAPKSNLLATFFAPGISSYPSPFRFMVLRSSAWSGAPISSGGKARGASSAVGFGSLRVGVGRGNEWKNGCDSDCAGACRHGRKRNSVAGHVDEGERAVYLSASDPFPRVIGEHPLQQVDRLGRRCAKQQAQIVLRFLLERRSRRQLGKALQTEGGASSAFDISLLSEHRCKLAGQSCSDGVPSAEKMTLSWSMSLSAAMNGTRSINSAKMHPAAQTSTPVLYDLAPSNNSGQRYHLRARQTHVNMQAMAGLLPRVAARTE